jgi:hypothetical protein
MISADEFKYELLTAYDDLALQLEAIVDDCGFLDGVSNAEDVIEVLSRAPDRIREVTRNFNERIAALQRRSLRVLQGGRQ